MRSFLLLLLQAGIYRRASGLVNSVADLYTALSASANKNVGFITSANYATVKNVLPSSVNPVYYTSPLTQTDMQNDVLSGKLFAAYISGDVPSGHFNYFSSRIISAQGMLTLDTPLLLKVVNAAVSQALSTGVPQTIIQTSYAGKPLTEIHTCSTSQGTAPAEAWPTVAELDTAAEPWWVRGRINIGTPYTSFGWFYNYKVEPTTGFYSDYYDAVNQIIVDKYKPAKPGFLGMQRVIDRSRTTSAHILAKLATQDGTLDATDMFFFYDVTFSGSVPAAFNVTASGVTSGQNTVTVPSTAGIKAGSLITFSSASSFPTTTTVTNVNSATFTITLSTPATTSATSETLTVTPSSAVSYSGAGRNVMFQPTCAFFGGDGAFFTQVALNTDAPVLSAGAVAGIVIGIVAFVAISIFMGVMIQRERSGKPMFTKLIDMDHQAHQAHQAAVFRGSPEEGYDYDGAAASSDSAMPPPPGPSGVAMTGVRGIN